MVAFPQLEPFRRGWSFGEYGMTEEPVWASVPVRFRHGRGSTQNVGQVLSLSFVDLYEDEVELIRAHYMSRDGGTLAFSLPPIVWAGLTAPPVPSTVSWVYQDVPVEVQKSGGLYDVTLSLLSVVAAGDGGGSVFADGFTETITLSFFGGAATSAQEGIRETVTVSLVGGEAIEALNGLRQTVAVTLAAGAADGGAGNVAGAAFTVNMSLAAGAGTSEVAGAALTVTVSLAAGAADGGGPTAYRYYRFDQITGTGGLLEVNEWAIVNDGVYVNAGTWTISSPGGQISLLNSPRMHDSVLTVGAGFRAVRISSPPSTDYLQYDHGSSAVATGFRYALFSNATTRNVTGFRISGSNDGTTFTTIGTRSGLTNPFTANGQLSAEIKFVP
jgi:hypothetical protein